MNELTLRFGLVAIDRDALATLLASAGAFGPSELAVGRELVEESLARGDRSGYRWVLAENDSRLLGFACYGPAPLTEGTFELYWIAVAPEARGVGVADRLDEAVTRAVRSAKGRWLLAETTSSPAQAPARRFYTRRGYALLGRLPEYHRVGVDRLTYGKRLDGERSGDAPRDLG